MNTNNDISSPMRMISKIAYTFPIIFSFLILMDQSVAQTAFISSNKATFINPEQIVIQYRSGEVSPYQGEPILEDSITLYINIANPGSQVSEQILYLNDLQIVSVHQTYDSINIASIHTGTLIPHKKRQIQRGLILPKVGYSVQARLLVPPGGSLLSMDIISPFQDPIVPKVILYPEKVWGTKVVEDQSKTLLIQGIMLGAILIFGLYHLLIFFQKWDRAFLFYALYTFGVAIVFLMESGLMSIYILPNLPYFHRFLEKTQLQSLFTSVMYLGFIREFVRLDQLLPKYDQALRKFLWVLVPSAILFAIIYGFSLNPFLAKMTYLFSFSLLIFCLIYLIAIFRTKDILPIYLIIGSTFLLIGALTNTVVSALINTGRLAEFSFNPSILVEVGVVIEIIIFALGLGYRQRLQEEEQKRIEELDLIKSKFFANISHEFRTPLTVIMGLNDQIKGHPDEKKLIKRNSQSLLQLVNQLLDLSKLDTGSLKINALQSDIIPYLQYLTESFASMAEQKQIQLTFYTEADTLVMDFDEEKIQSIIYNLLSNAIKYSESGDNVILHVKQAVIDKQVFLEIRVADTGIGIPQEDLKHIFNRFYQVDATHKRTEESTGLGLALTKELIQLMKGTIEVESQVNKGSTFTVLLPIKNEAPLQTLSNLEAPQDWVLSKQENTKEDTKIGKIGEVPSLLLIEDNPDVVTYIKSILATNYELNIAYNGEEGIEKAYEIIPDIIISDVMMPKKDGYEVCKSLKNDLRTSHIPIILLTAKAAAEDRIGGLRVGADAYLAKPFNKLELMVRLEKLLELRAKLQTVYSAGDIPAEQGKEANLEHEFVKKMREVVEARIEDPALGVVHLCQAARLSNMQVNRKLKALTGRTPSLFIRFIRLKKAKELLKNEDLTISEIAYDVGFSDPNYFSRAFSEEFGSPPSNFRG